MNEWLVALSFAIDWPTVGWVGMVAVSPFAAVWIVYEVVGEVRRKRRAVGGRR